MTPLAGQYDLLLLDLDGTVYQGHRPIEHAADSVRRARECGCAIAYVTNNASRRPAEVAQALTEMGLSAAADEVLTSPEAAAVALAAAHPAGSAVLVVGSPWLADAIAAAGLTPVGSADDNPVAVVQGWAPTVGWPELAEACVALRAGAAWMATNTDSTLPSDRGLLPGNGCLVDAIGTTTGMTPKVAGKPEPGMLTQAVRRVGASRPLVVGDRLETDIGAAVAACLPSLLVLTGVSTVAAVFALPPSQRPTYVARDLRGLVDAERTVALTAEMTPADLERALARTGHNG